MKSIANIVRTNGLVTYYEEGDQLFTVIRDGSGKPVTLFSKRGRWIAQEATFKYDGGGFFTGLSGSIKTSLLGQLLEEAEGTAPGVGVSTFAALTDRVTANLPSINTALAAALAAKDSVVVPTELTGNLVMSPGDDGSHRYCTTALTLSTPLGLSPRPGMIIDPPASGVLTITPTGGCTVNGSSSSITRAFATNRLGVAIRPNLHDVNDYSVSGV